MLFSFSRSLAALCAVSMTERPAAAQQLSGYAKDLFDESMSFLDNIYDPTAGYLSYFYYPLAAAKHETRSSMWYAAGLLQRNEGTDADEAVKIITNIIGDQNKNVSAQWYGDYTKYPEEPTVGSPAYEPVVSAMRRFVCSCTIVRWLIISRFIILGIRIGEASLVQRSS